jgi:FkbM family methyltransferase
MRRFLNTLKNHRNWLGYYIYKIFQSGKNGFTFRTRGGITIAVARRMMSTYKECFFDETYFKGFPKRKLIPSGATVIDIGANVGYFSLSVLSKFPGARVIAFEPMPANFKLLSQYQSENSTLNFTVINEAVSGEAGTLTLHYDAKDDFTTAASINSSGDQPDTELVRTTTLQNIISTYGISRIDLLKLDCEGSEYSILYQTPASSLQMIRAIAIETHQSDKPNENHESLIQFLNQNGFSTQSLRSKIWGWR